VAAGIAAGEAPGEAVLPVLLAVGETQPAIATRMAVAAAVGNKRNVDNMAVANFYVMCILTRKLLIKILNYLRAIHSTYLRSSLSNNFILSLFESAHRGSRIWFK
jgi:hypothetical protein